MKLIDMQDRFAKGAVAGLIASILQAGLNLFSYYVIHFSERRFISFAGVMIFGHKVKNLGEMIVSQLAHIGFSTGLAIIFAYFILGIKSKNVVLKGWFWGATIWFATFSIISITKFNDDLPIDVSSAISNFITASIWGIVLAVILNYLDSRIPEEQQQTSPEGTHKTVLKGQRYYLFPSPVKKIEVKKSWFGKLLKRK